MIQSMQARMAWPVGLSALVVLGVSTLCLVYVPSVPVAVLLSVVGTAFLAGLVARQSRIVLLVPWETLLASYRQHCPPDLRQDTIDDVQQLVDGYNAMCTSLRQQHDAARMLSEQMADALRVLLAEVLEVARGNLTVEALTTIPATESLATAFNSMVQQLRTVVGQVQDAVLQLSSSAHEIQATAEHIAQGSATQATQIVESSAALDEMVVSIQDVAEHATLSATVAEQALRNARQGTRAVQNTIEGMQRIRAQVQDAATRIQQLGARSQEINEMVQLIGDIADRTSVLALNASIEAALAGEAGQGFAIVAQEVERLAQRATAATRHIAQLMTTIQRETTEAMTAMDHGSQEVVAGSDLADEAGQTLKEIEGVSTRLAELIHSISQAAAQQARGSESLSRAMGDISGVTQQMATGTTQAAVSIHNLATLADELRTSVSMFRLSRTRHGHHLSA